MEYYKKLYCISVIFITLFLSGCNNFIIKHQTITDSKHAICQTDALKTIANFQNRNPDLNTFKGTGRIKIFNDEGKRSFRIAWIGSRPEKLRLSILNPLGQPIESISADGEHLYLLSHTQQHPFIKKKSENPDLTKFFEIPIKIRDVIDLLSGRVPICKYNTVKIAKSNFKNGYVLILKKRWWGITEKIFLDETQLKIYKIEIFNKLGNLEYSVFLNAYQNMGGFKILPNLTIINKDKITLEFSIDNYWANMPLSSDTFVLTP